MIHPDRLLRQLSSSELSEWIAYTELHPLSPGLERMLAQIAAVSFGNKEVGEMDFWIRKPAADTRIDTRSSLHELLRARIAHARGRP